MVDGSAENPVNMELLTKAASLAASLVASLVASLAAEKITSCIVLCLETIAGNKLTKLIMMKKANCADIKK